MKRLGVFMGVFFFLKLITLLGATAQTAGFIGLFAIDVLKENKWPLLIGGTLAIVFSEGILWALARRHKS